MVISKDRHLRYLALSATTLFMYMPFHVFLSQWLSTYTGGLEVWKLWKDFLTALVTILFIVTVIISKKQTKLYMRLLYGSALYFALHIVLSIFDKLPTDINLLATAYNLRLFAYLIIGYSLVLLFPKQNYLRKYAKILIVVSTIVCVIAFLQWVLPKDILTHFGYSIDRGVRPNFFVDNKTDFPRVFSTLKDPNSLGAFLILPIVLLFQVAVRDRKTSANTLLYGLLALHVLVLLMTFSRSTLLGTIGAVIAVILIKYRRVLRKNITKLAIIGLVALLLVVVMFALFKDSYIVQNVVFHADDSTVMADPNELRIRFLKDSTEAVIQEPLGHGPGSAGLVSIRTKNVFLTENYFLQIAHEVGVIGLLVFLGLLAVIIRRLMTLSSNIIISSLLASMVGLLIANMLFHTWANEAIAISWFMLAGMALGITKSTSSKESPKHK